MFDGIVSLGFFIVEFLVTIYYVSKSRRDKYFPQVLGMLIFLQLYQLFEFLACQFPDNDLFGRLGHFSITFLPPIGYHLSAKVMRIETKEIIFWYGLGVLFAFGFLLAQVLLCFKNAMNGTRIMRRYGPHHIVISTSGFY